MTANYDHYKDHDSDDERKDTGQAVASNNIKDVETLVCSYNDRAIKTKPKKIYWSQGLPVGTIHNWKHGTTH